MKTILVQRNKNPIALGKMCSLKSTHTLVENEKTVVKDETGRVIAILIPSALSQSEIQAGRNLIRYKKLTSNRTKASGVSAKKVEKYGQGMMGTAVAVNSSVVGYMENTHLAACRQTVLMRKNRDFFNNDTMKLIKKISALFLLYAPTQHRKQAQFIKKINPNMRLGKTVYTTATVNVDFRTLTHADKGDFSSGLGNLAVFQEDGKKWSGSEFLMPDFNLAIRLHEGDVLFADVHETHCNAKRVGGGRISLVLYARDGLAKKCHGVSKNELEYGVIKKY